PFLSPFFFKFPLTTDIYTLSLHDALPILYNTIFTDCYHTTNSCPFSLPLHASTLVMRVFSCNVPSLLANTAKIESFCGTPFTGFFTMLTFQQLILSLQHYWDEHGCVLLQPIDLEVGAGTSHTATFLRAIGPEPWRAAYVQPSRRPGDGRYGDNPNRLQHYYQYQVVLKPAPENIMDLYIGSLKALGIDPKQHDIRFVEDDWENPTLGAWGLGWEVWLNGMEITQFTYFQQVGGLDCTPAT